MKRGLLALARLIAFFLVMGLVIGAAGNLLLGTLESRRDFAYAQRLEEVGAQLSRDRDAVFGFTEYGWEHRSEWEIKSDY